MGRRGGGWWGRADARSSAEHSTPGKGPAAAAPKLPQLCPTLCDPIDSSPPGSAAPRCANAGSKGTSISKPFKTYRQIVFQTDVQIYILTSKV